MSSEKAKDHPIEHSIRTPEEIAAHLARRAARPLSNREILIRIAEKLGVDLNR